MKKALNNKFKSTIPSALGNLRGSMAGFVCYTHNGETIVRTKPSHPTVSKTDKQIATREGFKLIANAYKSFKEIVNIGFPDRSKNLTPYNKFMTANVSTAIDRSGNVSVIDYSKLTLSSGYLPMVTIKSLEADDIGISIIYKTDLIIPLISASDQIIAFAKLKTGELIITKQVRGYEESATIFIPLQGINSIEVECCYLFAL